MKPIFILFLFFTPAIFYSQTSTVTDTRDGNIYPYKKINGLNWMAVNLKFETDRSYFPNYNQKEERNASGNFYSNAYLNKICPEGWRLPTIDEWKNYFTMIGLSDETNKAVKKITTNERGMHMVKLRRSRFDVFKENNELNIFPVGGIEGNKWTAKKQVTFWAVNDKLNNTTTHVHVSGPMLGFSLARPPYI